MSFLSKQYQSNIELLSRIGLWDFEWSLILNPILQHCMPPPTVKAWKELLTRLYDLNINTDWARKGDVKKLISSLPKEGKIPSNSDDTTTDITDFPIFYAITKRYLYQQWSLHLQAKLLIEFIELVNSRIAPGDLLKNSRKYSRDIQRLRDAMIIDFSQEHSLPTHGKTEKDLESKYDSTFEIRHGRGWIGSDLYIPDSPSFWEQPPLIEVKNRDRALSPRSYRSHKVAPVDEQFDHAPDKSVDISNKGGLNSEEQTQALKQKIPVFIRNNVRSLADPNQLSWSCLISYWKQLLQGQKGELFVLSLLAFLTGIRRDRWAKFTVGSANNIRSDNIVYALIDGCLFYEVRDLATVFEKPQDGLSPIQFCLSLPKKLNSLLKTISEKLPKQGLQDSYEIRKFSEVNAGPSPTINRVANSGLKLFRNQFMDESELFIISGSIPIEFRARSCYASRNIRDLNDKFASATSELFTYLKENSFLDRNKFVSEKLQEFLSSESDTPPNGTVGSQIGNTYKHISFPTPHISAPGTFNANETKAQVLEVLNTLETYLYWMMQYGYANRPAGYNSGTMYIGNLLIHSDKNSRFYSESKLLFGLPVINEQLKEVLSSREQGYRQLERLGVQVSKELLDSYRPLYHLSPKQTGQFYSKHLTSEVAVNLAKEKFGIDFPFKRPNASRHQSSTYLHDSKGTPFADACLGHHIDGWDLTAPESSASVQEILKELKTVQKKFVADLGFKVLRGPWL
ncbi:hypothetical protein [Amphritea sp. HPY]|uniref:hypothetical protein n=1 Tax=Amphritea sp. HPY TaxID=3421652 RepID=UPI003D7E5A05